MSRTDNAVICEVFYSQYKMPDKMMYIKKVMDSCKTQEQLDAARKWGIKVLWGFFDVMSNDIFSFCIELCLIDRTKELCNEINRYYTILSKKIQYGEN